MERLQRQVCRRHGASFVSAPLDLIAGVAKNVSAGARVINGLRHHADETTTGWFIWAGEALELDDDFFQPLHVEHLVERCPSVLGYLGLAPGWRFLLAPGHEDVWFDASLLDSRS